jgi:hypothetical protein
VQIELNPADTEDALTHIVDLVAQLRDEHRELRQRFLEDRDGYPTQSMGGGGSPTNELDDDGTPIPQHSDPVGRLVVSRDDTTDPIGNTLAIVVRKIAAARRQLESAVSDAARSRPPLKHPDPDQIWCTSCERADIREPRTEGRSVCWWCRDYRAAHGRLPYPEILKARSRGIRITEQLIVRIEHERASKNRNRKKVRR